MRVSLLVRIGIAGAAFAALVTAPGVATTSFARVTLVVPASATQRATTLDVAGYALDAVANFSLIRRYAHATRTAAMRVTIVLPPPNREPAFAISGLASSFPALTVRQADATGTTYSTTFYDVRIVRVEPLASRGGVGRRITFTASRLANA